MIESDVSRLVGVSTVKFRGQDYLLDNFGFDDWSAVQSQFVRDKRARMIQAAIDAGQEFPPHEAQRLRQEAIEAAGNVAGLTREEYQQTLNQPAGMARFFWVMFERRYAGKLKVADIEQMIRENLIDEQKAVEIMNAIMFAMGLDPAKKKTDPA